MNILFKAYSRTFQMCFRILLPFLPYREPKRLEDISELTKKLKELNKKSILIVTDKGIINNHIIDPLINNLNDEKINYVIYDDVRPNPSVNNVLDGAKKYNDFSCDAIIALGGGSSIDCAKAIGAKITYPKKDLNKLKGILKVLKHTPTLIAIPTTSGTGSEVTLASVITDDKTNDKYAIMSFPLIPDYALLDPKFTYSLPKHLTSTTGLDALTHAIEAYIGRSTTKYTRACAIKAIKLIFENIKTSYDEPNNYNARKNMLDASYYAGISFSMSYVGNVHAMAHSLGGLKHVPHGLANSVILPIVLKYYDKKIYKKLSKIAKEIGLADIKDKKDIAAKKFICAIDELNNYMNIPNKILDFDESDIPYLVNHSYKEANPLYPVPMMFSKRDFYKLFKELGEFND